jgi:hypothetical protein
VLYANRTTDAADTPLEGRSVHICGAH